MYLLLSIFIFYEVIYISALILGIDPKRTVPLVTKSLSEEALRDVKKSIKLDRINRNIYRNIGKSTISLSFLPR